ncbi:conserved hypothetical protein [Candidatus Desulfarcum epimagneticum]|uniref:Radical SAM core domain-containing protein n=1 Tax=uncultured Desulfobacteraceae bacterium TaxID=218296 RepID=A0A484HL40_9BACT|nr:conserved hypothetical protein [uncultured Desulfobacteraceae bacterium]
MFEEKQPGQYHSAIVDVTDKCNLRRRHCFYFREEHDSRDMEEGAFLEGLETLRDRHNILSMGWCGGEPTYRRELLEKGTGLFKFNTIYSNGTLPFPRLPNAIVCVSIDGPPEVHNYIRGAGAFEKSLENVRRAKLPLVIFLTTINRKNAPHLKEMVSILSRVPNARLGVLFFTPLKTYRPVKGYEHTAEQAESLALSPEERDRAIEDLLEMKKEYEGFIFNPARTLELMMSGSSEKCVALCNMPDRTLTLDLRLERKLPCVLGRDVDCGQCGCVFPFLQQAKKEGDPESVALAF